MSDCTQCSYSREWPKSPGFDPSILRHSRISGAADEAVLNNVHKKETIPKNPNPPFNLPIKKNYLLLLSSEVELKFEMSVLPLESIIPDQRLCL